MPPLSIIIKPHIPTHRFTFYLYTPVAHGPCLSPPLSLGSSWHNFASLSTKIFLHLFFCCCCSLLLLSPSDLLSPVFVPDPCPGLLWGRKTFVLRTWQLRNRKTNKQKVLIKLQFYLISSVIYFLMSLALSFYFFVVIYSLRISYNIFYHSNFSKTPFRADLFLLTKLDVLVVS